MRRFLLHRGNPVRHDRCALQILALALGRRIGEYPSDMASLVDDDLTLSCFGKVLGLLDRLHDCGTVRDRAGNRRLFFDDYCKIVLLFLFNPAVRSLRLLQEAAQLPRVAKKLGIKRFSLGSFSEASALFEPERLKQIIAEVGAQAMKLPVTPELARLKPLLTIVDGTLLATLPKLAETLCHTRKDGRPHHAWRLHMHLPVGSLVPERINRTSGSNRRASSERQQLRQHLQSQRCYVLDRGFHDASLLNDIHQAGSSYVCRVRNDIHPQVLQELPLSEATRSAGIVWDRRVKISDYADGVRPASDHPLRLIRLRVEAHPKRPLDQGRDILVVTSLMDEPPELIGLIYRYRWTIELFFRMLKQLLGCRHLLSHRGQGVDIQFYCAVLACLLIYLQTGKKPSKYMLFMTGLYLSGVASLDDLQAFLNRPDNTGVKKRAEAERLKKFGIR